MVESYLTILGLLFSLLQWGIMLFWQCHCENCRRKQVNIPAYYIHDSRSVNHSYHFNFIIILQTTALWYIKVNAKQHDKLSCFWVYKHKPEQVSFGSGQSWQSDPRAIVSKSCPPITVPVSPTQTGICTNIKKKNHFLNISARGMWHWTKPCYCHSLYCKLDISHRKYTWQTCFPGQQRLPYSYRRCCLALFISGRWGKEKEAKSRNWNFPWRTEASH